MTFGKMIIVLIIDENDEIVICYVRQHQAGGHFCVQKSVVEPGSGGQISKIKLKVRRTVRKWRTNIQNQIKSPSHGQEVADKYPKSNQKSAAQPGSGGQIIKIKLKICHAIKTGRTNIQSQIKNPPHSREAADKNPKSD